jgi:uncharacterized OB-fold protein
VTTVGMTQRDASSAEFFDGTARGELLIRECEACGQHAPPPVAFCGACGSDRMAWVPSAGQGTVVSWSVVHPRPGAEPSEPVVIGILELDEGPWVYGRLVGDVAEVAVGLSVTVEFARPEGEAVPVYRLAGSAT